MREWGMLYMSSCTQIKNINILLSSDGRIICTDCENRNYCKELIDKFNIVKKISKLKDKINTKDNDFLVIDERIVNDNTYYFVQIQNKCYSF
jgi:hypothetical protein